MDKQECGLDRERLPEHFDYSYDYMAFLRRTRERVKFLQLVGS